MLNLPTMLKELHTKYDEEKELAIWYSTDDDATPLAKLPLEKVRGASAMFDSIYKAHLQLAFEKSDCNWELGISDLRGPETIEYFLPEFQSSRDLSHMMALRTRLALAEHRYDDAITLMRQQYRLGGDVAK